MAYHCDGACDTWQRADTDLPADFIIVTAADGAVLGHFCTLDCAGRWAIAHSEPTEEVAA